MTMNKNTIEKKAEVEKLHEKLREMAREQGVKPITRIQDLYKYSQGENGESVDEFLNWVQEIRKSDKGRREIE